MKTAQVIVYLVATIAVVTIGVGTRLQHPDMTSTRLWLEYWPRFIACIVLAVAAIAFGDWADSR